MEVTREQILAALQAKQSEPSSTQTALNIGKSFLGGGSSGATGLLGIPFEVANLPNATLNYLAGINEPSPTQLMTQKLGVPQEPQSGLERAAYLFGEGAIPAASVTGAATLNPVLAAGAGLLGGVTNLAAKTYFPESPVGQAVFSLLPGTLAGSINWARNKVPQVPKPTTLQETQMTATAGQMAGSEKLLRAEKAVAGTQEGTPIFQQMGLSNVANAEDFANKIQTFTKNPNLTSEQIANATVEALNYHNNRVVNKFRVENRKNFSAAQAEAGDARIFDTNNVNRVLDEQIVLYNQPSMPAELQAYAKKLQQVKDGISKQTVFEGQTVNTPLTIQELQKNLESWGKAAKTGQYTVDGVQLGDVAPGSMKKLSRDVLNAFRDDLDAANLQNVPGAQKLIDAREKFKTGLKEVNDFQTQSFVKWFGKENPDATDVVNYLKSGVTPTERTTMFKLLGQSRPEVLDSIRSRTMQDLITASEGNLDSMLLNFKSILKEKPEAGAVSTKELLFPTKAEQAKANQLVNDLEIVTRKASGTAPSEGALSRTTGEVAGTSFGYKARMAVNTAADVFDLVSSSTSNPQKMAWMMTNPDGQTLVRYAATVKAGQKLPSNIQNFADYLASDVLVGGTVSAGGVNTARESGKIIQPAPQSVTEEQIKQRLKELENQ